MRGDFSRVTFDPAKAYRGVLMQQGRAVLDADWNEQVLLAEHRFGSFFRDVVGQHGAPVTEGLRLVQGASGAVALDGSGGVRVADVPIDQASFTVELWFSVAPDADPDVFLTLLRLGSSSLAVGVRGGDVVVTNPGAPGKAPPRVGLGAGPWHHLAYTHRDDVRELRCDGTANQWGVAAPSIIPVTPDADARRLTVGGYDTEADTFGFVGRLAELRVWQPARSDAELDELERRPAKGTETGLRACLPLDGRGHRPIALDLVPGRPAGTATATVAAATRTGPFAVGAITRRRGRCYVDGLLVELPEDETLVDRGAADGLWLAYLDAWSATVSASEDDTLRDPALGGPDTTVRLRTVTELRQRMLIPLSSLTPARALACSERFDHGWPLAEPLADWERATGSGRLAVTADGYRSRGNWLVRVEVHGALTGDRWLAWSRDNAGVGSRGVVVDPHTVELDWPSPAATEAFGRATWVEVTPVASADRPGVITPATGAVVAGRLRVKLPEAGGLTAGAELSLRAWDGAAPLASGRCVLPELLEVEIVDPPDRYRAGDHWLLVVRDGRVVGAHDARLPDGPTHHFVPLGLVDRRGDSVTLVRDLVQTLAPQVDGYLSRDGGRVAHDLQVGGDLAVGLAAPKAPLTVAAHDSGALAALMTATGAPAWTLGVTDDGALQLAAAAAPTASGVRFRTDGGLDCTGPVSSAARRFVWTWAGQPVTLAEGKTTVTWSGWGGDHLDLRRDSLVLLTAPFAVQCHPEENGPWPVLLDWTVSLWPTNAAVLQGCSTSGTLVIVDGERYSQHVAGQLFVPAQPHAVDATPALRFSCSARKLADDPTTMGVVTLLGASAVVIEL